MNDVSKTFLNKKDPMLDVKEMLYDRLGILKSCYSSLRMDERDECYENEMEFIRNVLDVIERS